MQTTYQPVTQNERMPSRSWDIKIIPSCPWSRRWKWELIWITHLVTWRERRRMVPTIIMDIHWRESIWTGDFSWGRWTTPKIVKTGSIWNIPTRCWRWMNWPQVCNIWARMCCGWNRCMFSKYGMMAKKITICEITALALTQNLTYTLVAERMKSYMHLIEILLHCK